MRVRLPGFDRVDLARLFSEYIEKQQQVQRVQPQQAQPGNQPRLQFKFLDSFESSSNGAQQWLVRREVGEAQGVSGSRGLNRPERTERSTRSLFADGFEPSRVKPVDLGQTRSTVNRFQPSADPTQAAAQDNGFHASVNDV